MILCGQKKHSAHRRGIVDLAFGDVIDRGGCVIASALAVGDTRAIRPSLGSTMTARRSNMIPPAALQTARPLCTTLSSPDDLIFIAALKTI
jgi:hypothetical protein